jgi:hypothetical protein
MAQQAYTTAKAAHDWYKTDGRAYYLQAKKYYQKGASWQTVDEILSGAAPEAAEAAEAAPILLV